MRTDWHRSSLFSEVQIFNAFSFQCGQFFIFIFPLIWAIHQLLRFWFRWRWWRCTSSLHHTVQLQAVSTPIWQSSVQCESMWLTSSNSRLTYRTLLIFFTDDGGLFNSIWVHGRPRKKKEHAHNIMERTKTMKRIPPVKVSKEKKENKRGSRVWNAYLKFLTGAKKIVCSAFENVML